MSLAKCPGLPQTGLFRLDLLASFLKSSPFWALGFVFCFCLSLWADLCLFLCVCSCLWDGHSLCWLRQCPCQLSPESPMMSSSVAAVAEPPQSLLEIRSYSRTVFCLSDRLSMYSASEPALFRCGCMIRFSSATCLLWTWTCTQHQVFGAPLRHCFPFP